MDFASSIEYAEIDISEGFIRIKPKGGELQSVEHSTLDPHEEKVISKVRYKTETSEVEFVLQDGFEFTTHISTHEESFDKPKVPIVYLDQCHWSALAKSLYEPQRVSEGVLGSAQELIDMARSGEVVLPISSGHLIETTALYDTRRINLAKTMLELSKGWQMYHPLKIRTAEIISIFSYRYRGKGLEYFSPFTMKPGRIYSDYPYPPLSELTNQGFPLELAYLHRNLLHVSALYSTLLDPEKIEAPNTQWGVQYENLAKQMKQDKVNSSDMKRYCKVFAMQDAMENAFEAAAALGLSNEEFEDWFKGKFLDDMPKLPSVGLFSDVLYSRMRNYQEKWKKGDLVDITFLVPAMAYASVTVAENRATNYLREAWGGRETKPLIFSTISEAVAELKRQ